MRANFVIHYKLHGVDKTEFVTWRNSEDQPLTELTARQLLVAQRPNEVRDQQSAEDAIEMAKQAGISDVRVTAVD